MLRDRMQRQRFERKYRIGEAQAQLVREFVRSYLVLDENGVGKPNYSYPVHSIYLDSDDLKTYWMTVNSNKNRFKLRLRFYDDQPGSPVFMEIKRRVDNCILKQRAGLNKTVVAEVLAGQLPSPEQLLSPDSSKALTAIQNFVRLAQGLQARPKVHVAYLREAWIDPQSDAIRVTFDREVRGEPRATAQFSCEMTQPVVPFGNMVILELKFTNRFPNWLRDLVERFDLMTGSAAKYCESVELIGPENLGPGLYRGPLPAEPADPPEPPPPPGPVADDVNTHRMSLPTDLMRPKPPEPAA